MDHYSRIAQIIDYLAAHHVEQPDLDRLASQVGLSPHHFHRLFSEWVGVTPKDFLQCLTLQHARGLLQRGESVLGAALESGLSGPGRLHDLCVTLEAASPGEIKSGGRGWTLRYGEADTLFGRCLIGESPRGLCHLSFLDAAKKAEAVAAMREAWPHAHWERDEAMAGRWAAHIFQRSQATRTLKAFVRGTAFQVRVWRALLQIPPGALVSYGALAQVVDHPRASRAVGTAVGLNPIAYLIPCHRVIRQTGIIGNYRWNPVRKRMLIAWESLEG